MDYRVLLYYIGFGAMVKLVTMHRPTPGQKWATVGAILAGGFTAGHLSDALLGEDFRFAVIFISIPMGLALIENIVSGPFDRARIVYRRWIRDGKASKTRRQVSR